MSTAEWVAEWVADGLSAAAIAISLGSVWRLRRTLRSAQERIARAEAKHREAE